MVYWIWLSVVVGVLIYDETEPARRNRRANKKRPCRKQGRKVVVSPQKRYVPKHSKK